MKTVLYFIGSLGEPFSRKYEGMMDRATSYGWRLRIIPLNNTPSDIFEYLDYWKPDGCIIDYSEIENPPPIASLPEIPTVFLNVDPSHAPPNAALVNVDTDKMVELAVRELESIDAQTYAYIGYRFATYWSLDRGRKFAARMKANGKPCHIYPDGWGREGPLKAQLRLRDWLKSLPKPYAIFTANDETAEIVIDAAQFAGIAIPEDMALLSVDDIAFFCENARPTLSSIRQDFAAGGRLTADLLRRLMAGENVGRIELLYGGFSLVRRQSTIVHKVRDPAIERALEEIRLNSSRRLTAAEILANIGGGRRSAEMRFRAVMGTSVYETIIETKLAHVCELLRRPRQAISPIANICGWKSEAHLKRLFKQRMGMTMREWRQREA